VLIEDGILKGYLQDRLNARLMGMEPTGNGRRESFAHAPMPRMTNTFMLAGKDDPAELVERVKDGIYAKSFGGGQVDITSGKFVFSCTEAYRIRGGKIAEPIKGATLIGDGPTVLTRVKGIGNDLALDEGVGICGKGGQSDPGRRRPADPADRRPDGRRHGRLSDWRATSSNSGSGSIPTMVEAATRARSPDPQPLPQAVGREAPASGRCFLGDPLTALAAVILFDQFPRNMFRGHADQFATDHLALAIAKGAVDKGFDDELEPQGARLPLHAVPAQRGSCRPEPRSVLLFTALGDD
jgi:hypothetical protein